jgi:outer membrane protein assembly factor BamB
MVFFLLSVHAHAAMPIPNAPWPSFRGNIHNTGFKDATFKANPALKTWSYQTGKGIFSTAVVDEKEQVYLGSADSWFYAFSPGGHLLWRYKTGEIIDSAATLSTDGTSRWITIPSGDGLLHQLRLPTEGAEQEPELVWTFDTSQHPHPAGKGYNWFEGNVVLGRDGKYYAGNTNWNFYAVSDKGELAWTFAANNMNWSAAAFDQEGFLYTASLDGRFRKLNPANGQVVWKRSSLGFNAGSLALADGLVIGTSFDHRVYAMNPDTGAVLWTFATSDHIYGSAAVSGHGPTLRIYVTSTDGYLYALTREGKLLWTFDGGDVIRSSPVVNRSPEGQDVIYFGGGDGLLRAVNQDGSLRWAFDTSADDPYLGERNDLNASPALTTTAVIIGGEHGLIWSIPYDYPLLHPEDPRSIISQPKLSDGIQARLVTPGSRLLPAKDTMAISPATVLVIRLENIVNGQRNPGGVNAWRGKTQVTIEPALPFSWEPSAQADTIYIRPRDFWEPGQRYRVSINGQWRSDGLKIGAVEIGGTKAKAFSSSVDFTVSPMEQGSLPWEVSETEADALEIHRLSVNQPSLMPSLNQIGFDSYHFLASLIEKSAPDDKGEGQLLAWIRSARPNADGTLKPSVDAEFRFPLVGRYKGDSFILTGQNIPLNLGGIQIKLKLIEFRGQFTKDKGITPMTSFYAEPAASVDLSYGPALAAMGIINKNLKVPMLGTFLARPSQSDQGTKANYQVTQICVTPSTLWKDGHIRALVEGDQEAADQGLDFVLYDKASLQPVLLPSPPLIQTQSNSSWSVEQTIPRTVRSGIWDSRLMDGVFPIAASCAPH